MGLTGAGPSAVVLLALGVATAEGAGWGGVFGGAVMALSLLGEGGVGGWGGSASAMGSEAASRTNLTGTWRKFLEGKTVKTVCGKLTKRMTIWITALTKSAMPRCMRVLIC